MSAPPWLHCRIDSPLGQIQLARTDRGLCGTWFVDEQKHAPAPDHFVPAQHKPDDPLLRLAAEQLQAYFGGRLLRFDVPLDLRAGTPFQQAVWQKVAESCIILFTMFRKKKIPFSLRDFRL